ncbi:hypothetical protein D9756_007118 [Leucocoprinus leucothites]|uniref:Uncharacterized protein n=1 Tax=Leucocoprinus leucothites TaxID=201217 RepID=A0A8H5D5E3_9AGAR|nr:hypothetical protein D9756_007118 [Leucoagaricus leucothites]
MHPDSQSQRASETDRQLRLQHRHHLQHHEANSGVTPPTAATSSAGDRIPNTLTRPTLESNPSSSSAASENILLLNSPGPRESRRKKNKLSSSDGKTITILKRAPEASGSGSNAYGALSSGMVAVGLNDANYNNNTHHYHHGGDGGLSSSYSHSHLHTRSHSNTRDSHVEATATSTTTTHTSTGVHTQAHANTTVGESLLSATATSTKADGVMTPRAYDIRHAYEGHGYGYLYPRDRRQRDFGSEEGEEEEGDDGGGEEGGGGEMEWCIDKYGQRRRRRKGTIPSRLVHDGNGDSLAVMGGVGEMEWYLDRYGRRQRRIRSWEATAVYEPHSRRRESGPNGVIYGGMDEDRHDEDRHDEDEDEDEDEEEAEEEEEESGSESESATEQSLIRPPEAITGSVAEEEGAEDANGDPLTEEKTNTKTKAKRKKTKKRKVPVTHPLSSTGAALASALAHSHSVPNLRSTITTTGSADLSTTEAEDGDGDEDDYDRDDRREVASSSSTSGGDKDVRGVDGNFPGLSPGLGNGLGLSTTTTTLGTGTVTLKKEKKEKKKKKKKEKPVFVLRGDPQLGRSLGIIFATTTDDSAAEEFGFGFGKQRQRHARLVLLARHLQVLFPEETEVLGKVVAKLAPPPPPGFVSDDTRAGLNKKEKKKQKQKGSRVLFLDDDCSLEYSSLASSDLQRATGATERGDGFPFRFDGYGYDPDPRGDVPGRKDTLVHVFIDHSNILIGLLSHIKRTSRKLKIPPSSSSSSKHVYPPSTDGITRSTNTTGSRPLPIPKTKAGVPVLETKPIIPLPSFAVSRSAPTTMSKGALKSALLAHRYDVASEDSGDVNDLGSSGVEIDGEEEDVPVFEFEDERYGFEKSTRGVKEGQGILLAAVGLKAKQKQKEKQKEKAAVAIKRSPHLWHAALALVLERGRPVTRRVVVASSPLYQPMDDMERLGYEVSVLTRVPDLGDGADRLEKAARHESSSSHNKDADYNNNYYGSSSPTKGSRSIGKSHSRRILMNGECSMGSTSSGGAATQTTGQGSTPLRVKYREQGVDELLQLKLLTVIAATERVPEGATIVLATGDGNVGQFNEDGYLGPVRMALKHGWKVELYAWEDGLSRSWRREFGPTSEWGRKGMFRVIAMEQFAECLVDLGY